jgi:hypothetical protein
MILDCYKIVIPSDISPKCKICDSSIIILNDGQRLSYRNQLIRIILLAIDRIKGDYYQWQHQEVGWI